MRKGHLRCSTLHFPVVPNTGRWVSKEWNGLENFENKAVVRRNIWTDGKKIYYSYGDTQLVLNGNTWEPKEWNLVPYYGDHVWTDGTNIYYTDEYHYVLEDGIWKTINLPRKLSSMRSRPKRYLRLYLNVTTKCEPLLQGYGVFPYLCISKTIIHSIMKKLFLLFCLICSLSSCKTYTIANITTFKPNGEILC